MFLRKLFSKAIIIFILIGTQTKTSQIHAHNHYERLQCYLDGYLIDKKGNWVEEVPPEDLQISYGAEYIIEKGNQSKYSVRKILILPKEDIKISANTEFEEIIEFYKKSFTGNYENTKLKNGKITYFDDLDNHNVILDLTNKTISRRDKSGEFGHKGECRLLALKYPPQRAVNLLELGRAYSDALYDSAFSDKEKGEKKLRMYRESLGAFESWSDTIYPEEMPVYRDFAFLYLLMGNVYHFTIKDDKLAAAEYSKAIDTDPTYMYAYRRAAESYFASEQYTKAKEVLNSYLENWKNKPIVSRDAARGYYLRGVINAMFSKKKEACNDFKKAKLTNDEYRVKVDDILNNKELNPCS